MPTLAEDERKYAVQMPGVGRNKGTPPGKYPIPIPERKPSAGNPRGGAYGTGSLVASGATGTGGRERIAPPPFPQVSADTAANNIVRNIQRPPVTIDQNPPATPPATQPVAQQPGRVFDAGDGQTGINILGGTVSSSSKNIQNLLSGTAKNNRYSGEYLRHMAGQGLPVVDKYSGEQLVRPGGVYGYSKGSTLIRPGEVVKNPYGYGQNGRVVVGGAQADNNARAAELEQRAINAAQGLNELAPRLSDNGNRLRLAKQSSANLREQGASATAQSEAFNRIFTGEEPNLIDQTTQNALQVINQGGPGTREALVVLPELLRYQNRQADNDIAQANITAENQRAQARNQTTKEAARIRANANQGKMKFRDQEVTDRRSGFPEKFKISYLVDNQGNKFDPDTREPWPSRDEAQAAFMGELQGAQEAFNAQGGESRLSTDDLSKRLMEINERYFRKYGYDFSGAMNNGEQ